MTEATTTTKIDEAFGAAWLAITEPLGLDAPRDIYAKRAFAAGARAFSTMPLCEHGRAVWGLEHCDPCAEAGGPGEFPGYNRPFEVDLPEGMTQGHLEDLQAEHEALRVTLMNLLAKVGLIESTRAPWDALSVLKMASLWLADAIPLMHPRGGFLGDLKRLERRVGCLETWAATAASTPTVGIQEAESRQQIQKLIDTMREAAITVPSNDKGVHPHVVGCWVRTLERVIAGPEAPIEPTGSDPS